MSPINSSRDNSSKPGTHRSQHIDRTRPRIDTPSRSTQPVNHRQPLTATTRSGPECLHSVHKTIAEAVCGTDAEIIKGETVYRVMAKVNRLVPTNVGLIDVRSRARRFSMHVGADVVEGFPTAEAQTKSKTNIFANGYENGFHVGFGGSLKGRIWSARTVKSLSEWADWCDRVGAKITDESISVDEVMKDFIRPQIVRERPDLAILAVDWPYELYFNTSDETTL
ncbi:hypothetical protein [Micromonospora craniellae]|uniref:hypothetical protein n=1 Tax=Micromonospora craniellae TaxID=2294034 RepID=UPI00168A6160|nr:hypothetical protein [Micromonospora craniellae]QOC90845.1 hypothetical protein ID554_22490 [Micromonospora craniellae]